MNSPVFCLYSSVLNKNVFKSSMPKFILFFDDKFGGNWREELYSDYQKGRKEAALKYTQNQKEEQDKRKKYLAFLKEKIFSKPLGL